MKNDHLEWGVAICVGFIVGLLVIALVVSILLVIGVL